MNDKMSMINNEIQCTNNEAKISTREHDTNDQNDHESVASVIDLTNDSEVDSEDDSSVIDLVSDREFNSGEEYEDDGQWDDGISECECDGDDNEEEIEQEKENETTDDDDTDIVVVDRRRKFLDTKNWDEEDDLSNYDDMSEDDDIDDDEDMDDESYVYDGEEEEEEDARDETEEDKKERLWATRYHNMRQNRRMVQYLKDEGMVRIDIGNGRFRFVRP